MLGGSPRQREFRHPGAGTLSRREARALDTDDDEEILTLIERCGAMTCGAWGDHGEPAVPEIRLLRDLWAVADPSERTVLAAAMARAFARDDE